MVTMRIVPARIACTRLGQPEEGADRGCGDGCVVSAVCGSPPESFALCTIKGEEQTRKRCGFGQHQTLLCSCSKCSRVSTFTLVGVPSSPAPFTSVPVRSRADIWYQGQAARLVAFQWRPRRAVAVPRPRLGRRVASRRHQHRPKGRLRNARRRRAIPRRTVRARATPDASTATSRTVRAKSSSSA